MFLLLIIRTQKVAFISWTQEVITDYISNYLELINDIYRFIIHNNLLDENCNDDTEDVVINFLKNNKVLLVIDNLVQMIAAGMRFQQMKGNYHGSRNTAQSVQNLLSSTYKCNFLGADNKQ